MSNFFTDMALAETHRVLVLNDVESGLRAFIAIDDLTLGPACGGIRTCSYRSAGEALRDAQQLARAMTLKCAIADLPAGGAKTVVLVHPEMNRGAAFQRLGAYIEELNGLYLCAGDLGTTPDDLTNVAKETQYAVVTGEALGAATGETITNCIRACVAVRGGRTLANLTVSIQGCGLIGSALARKLAAEGARIIVSDIDQVKAAALAKEVDGHCVSVDESLLSEADVIAPCATGAVITEEIAREMKAWAICGGANNQLKDERVLDTLAGRNILFVPDFLASSGAVIDGVCRNFLAQEPTSKLAGVYETALEVLTRARRENRHTTAVAVELARNRIRDIRRKRLERSY